MSAASDEMTEHDATSMLDVLPASVVVHVLSFTMREHQHAKPLETPKMRIALEGEEMPRVRQSVNGQPVGGPWPATREEVRLEHERVNRKNEAIVRFNMDKHFDDGYNEPAVTRGKRIEPAHNFCNALTNKWGAVLSFSRTSRQNKSLARDAGLWRGFEEELTSAFPLVPPPGRDLQSVVRSLMEDRYYGGAHEVASFLDPRISSDATTTAQAVVADPFARTAALAAYITRVLSRMETVIDDMLALENGAFHSYFMNHVGNALVHRAAGLDPDQTLGDIREMLEYYISAEGRASLRHSILSHLVYDVFRKKGCLASERSVFDLIYYPIMKVCAGGPLVARSVVDMPNVHRERIVELLLGRLDHFIGRLTPDQHQALVAALVVD